MPINPSPELVSVVMCTRDRSESILAAVESVLDQQDAGLELIVVDQSRGSGTRELLEPLAERNRCLRYVHLDRSGLSRAYNAGVERAAGALIAFTDDDCIARPGWLAAIASAFTRDPNVDLLYGQVLLPPELASRENVDGVTPQLSIPKRRWLSLSDGFQVFGMGANFAIRRRAWKSVGGFDEVLGGGGPLQSAQDFDFAYRVYRTGGLILLEPSVIVYHYGFRSNRDWPAVVRSYGVGVGAFYYKHARLGDLYAARLLLTTVAEAAARVLKRALLRQPPEQHWTYLANIVAGVLKARGFRIDPDRRVYLTTDAA